MPLSSDSLPLSVSLLSEVSAELPLHSSLSPSELEFRGVWSLSLINPSLLESFQTMSKYLQHYIEPSTKFVCKRKAIILRFLRKNNHASFKTVQQPRRQTKIARKHTKFTRRDSWEQNLITSPAKRFSKSRVPRV